MDISSTPWKATVIFVIQFFKDFFLGPVEVHVVLDAFEVGNGHAAGIAQEIRDHEDTALL